MFDFTVEEVNLIAMYREDGGDRADVIMGIAAALPYMEDDMLRIVDSAVKKLTDMSAEEYAAATFDPADD
ncbi:hypothetical protein FACS1894217_06980 [Clostridia bacterium]|nr:hypothetical protein FACS1894202_09600 [Clostridia bacterium]GHV07045.1 hypothetical protein FACS1894217_06980 [Clostridia bacterium]